MEISEESINKLVNATDAWGRVGWAKFYTAEKEIKQLNKLLDQFKGTFVHIQKGQCSCGRVLEFNIEADPDSRSIVMDGRIISNPNEA